MKMMLGAVGDVAREVVLLDVLLMKRTPDAVGGVAKEVAVVHVHMHACLGAPGVLRPHGCLGGWSLRRVNGKGGCPASVTAMDVLT